MCINRRTLIQELQGVSLLDGRYTDIQVVNCDPATGKPKDHGGVLSVVFKAEDTHSGQAVAIKFFDPDLNGPQLNYRFDLFQRECDLLKGLSGKERCLRLHAPISQFDIGVSDPTNGRALTIAAYYYVSEWLDNDINAYFHKQEEFEAEEKLRIFREVFLAVHTLHRHGIYHRDLKADNLRIATRNGHQRAVAIDLGTAAAFDSPSLGRATEYAQPVGAPAYAPIESHCGLAAIRALGIPYDIYALGCMLYDLFNSEMYFLSLLQDSGFQTCLGACQSHMMAVRSQTSKESSILREWQRILSLSSRQVTRPHIAGPHSSVPPSIEQPLGRLLNTLTQLDYRRRLTDHNRILRYIDTALNLLANRRSERRRLDRKRQLRARRLEKLAQRDHRLARYLEKRPLNGTESC